MATSAPLGCDLGLATSARAAGAARRPSLVLITSILASSLAFVDGSVVNVGLPAIGRSLGADAAALQWAVNAYLLPLSALLLFGGALGDRFGRGRLLILGVIIFGAASAGCAAAPDLRWLLAARVIQGIGSALVLPNSLAVLGGAFTGAARGRAVGMWAAASAISSAIGPVLGGWLIDLSGWRAIFLINLPLAAAAGVFALISVRDAPTRDSPTALDLTGAALGTAALGGLAWALTVGSGPAGWTSAALAVAVASVLLSLAFARVEAVKGDRAMTPPALFGSRKLVALNVMTLLLYGALGGFMVLLPYVLIAAARYPATAAGAALLPFPIVMAVGGPIVGGWAGRFGPQAPLTLGAFLAGVGFVLATRIDADGAYWTTVFPCVLVVAIGMAAAAAPLTTAILSSVDARHTGSASGLNSAVARAGGLVATALLGSVLAAPADHLMMAFHVSAAIGGVLAAGAALSAYLAFRSPAR